jgi:hypothetical protein
MPKGNTMVDNNIGSGLQASAVTHRFGCDGAVLLEALGRHVGLQVAGGSSITVMHCR